MADQPDSLPNGRPAPLSAHWATLQRGGGRDAPTKPRRRVTATRMTTLFLCWYGLAGLAGLYPQTTQNTQAASSIQNSYTGAWQIPSSLREQFRALGDRMQKPGKEWVVTGGTYSDASGSCSMQITSGLGNNVLIGRNCGQGNGNGNNGSIAFSSSQAWTQNGAIRSEDLDLLASLVDDPAETLFASVSVGGGWKSLGRGFPIGAGYSCDLYEVAAVSKVQSAAAPRLKRYCFDSKTLLLRWVHYAPSGSLPAVTVTFGNWQTVSGEAVPGSISRQSGGTTEFTFQVQQTSVTSQGNSSIFQIGTAVSPGR
jgi:hypothetical protein